MQTSAYNITASNTGFMKGYATNESISKHNSSDHLFDKNAYVQIFEEVIAWIIFCIGMPAVCLAIYALYHLVKADRVAPIYVINLLISDIVQIIVRVVFISERLLDSQDPEYIVAQKVLLVVVRFGLIASLWFMVCISLERYLVVVHPLWYRYHRNIKHSVVVSVTVWLSAAIYAAIDYNVFKDQIKFSLVFSILFILPSPLLVFLYVGTKRALATTIAVSNTEKKRIMGVLTLVLGTYAFLFLPFTFISFYLSVTKKKTFTVYCLMAIARSIVRMSPLVDPFLYIFMRKNARETMEVFPCCRRLMSAGHSWSSADQEDTRTRTTASDDVTKV